MNFPFVAPSLVGLVFLSFAGWRMFRAFVPADDARSCPVWESARNIPFWCWWAFALVGLQACAIGPNTPPPLPGVAFLSSLPIFYVLRAMFRAFNKPPEKRNQNKPLKSFVKKLIVFVVLLFLVEVIWSSVSLHAWIFFFSGVAVFYIFSYLIKHKK